MQFTTPEELGELAVFFCWPRPTTCAAWPGTWTAAGRRNKPVLPSGAALLSKSVGLVPRSLKPPMPNAPQRPDRILVVDDDARIRDLLKRYLTQEGLPVLLAEDGRSLNRLLQRETVDLIVLDLMLPGEDGLSICRRLREAKDRTPIIMPTAKSEDIDRIVGLEVGADDYLGKPFNPRELLARIHAVLRRRPPPEVPGAPRARTRWCNSAPTRSTSASTRTLRKNRTDLSLTTGEFAMLKALVRHPPAAVARQARPARARARVRALRPQPRRAGLAPAQADRGGPGSAALHPDRLGRGLCLRARGQAGLKRWLRLRAVWRHRLPQAGWHQPVLAQLVRAGADPARLHAGLAAQSYRALEFEPRARACRAHARSPRSSTWSRPRCATPTRSRIALIKTWLDEEEVQISVREPGDSYQPYDQNAFGRKISAELTQLLGKGTLVARQVNGREGLWVGFQDRARAVLAADRSQARRCGRTQHLAGLVRHRGGALAAWRRAARAAGQPAAQETAGSSGAGARRAIPARCGSTRTSPRTRSARGQHRLQPHDAPARPGRAGPR